MMRKSYLEIRAGTGSEAYPFTGNSIRMYLKYCEKKFKQLLSESKIQQVDLRSTG
jgi:protein subunit release factor A